MRAACGAQPSAVEVAVLSPVPVPGPECCLQVTVCPVSTGSGCEDPEIVQTLSLLGDTQLSWVPPMAHRHFPNLAQIPCVGISRGTCYKGPSAEWPLHYRNLLLTDLEAGRPRSGSQDDRVWLGPSPGGREIASHCILTLLLFHSHPALLPGAGETTVSTRKDPILLEFTV